MNISSLSLVRTLSLPACLSAASATAKRTNCASHPSPLLRRYLEKLPPEQAGWLAGLRDPLVGKALSLMHAKPAYNWALEELAKQAGLSRSVLAERFTQFVGIPPIQYLTKWRMQIATELLTGSNINVASIAAQIGYESEAAFSRAFKKMIGVAPSAWRRTILEARAAES
jgi:transcriptional regulator GlxA family with amidase domain